jgi:hypothetical protein
MTGAVEALRPIVTIEPDVLHVAGLSEALYQIERSDGLATWQDFNAPVSVGAVVGITPGFYRARIY